MKLNKKIMLVIGVIIICIICILIHIMLSNENNVDVEENINITKSEKQEVILTERQKRILQSEGLPQNYEELTISQKSGITRIESGLKYLEDKYNKEFIYKSYTPSRTGR